ncbi:MAG: cyclic pyranopterin monophosphate synthase MoaC [Deltaproteobacteria bacterium]|nr:cyclic pyranopterin monophosphate synthase MoaC [Deltaproteobacteria bacterium]
MKEFTHFDEKGRPKMVDVSDKESTLREAVVTGSIIMEEETLKMILDKRIEKGDVFSVAQIAGIMGAKKTFEVIPMCHPLPITSIKIEFSHSFEPAKIDIKANVKAFAKTGVEMEAFTAVSVAALTIYDMCKAVDRKMEITGIKLLEKKGGKSGHFVRESSS